jgi:hypothetical protein
MQCAECGASFVQSKPNQRFCGAAHSNKHRQKLFHQRKLIVAQQVNGEELDSIKREHERLKEQNESLKDSIRKYDKHISDKDKEIDHWRDLLRIRDEEIERLKLERRAYQQEKTKKAS